MRSCSPLRPAPPLVALLLLVGCAGPPPRPDTPAPTQAEAQAFLEAMLEVCQAAPCPLTLPATAALDSLALGPDTLDVYFTPALAHRPFRPGDVDTLRALVRDAVAPHFAARPLRVWAGRYEVADLVPNFYRDAADRDPTRLPPTAKRPAPLVTDRDQAWTPTAGLQGRYVALWPSHGWYYEAKLDRWEWQRARLFQAVEDLIPLAFVEPYLAPMLERAGATVLMPRERDLQRHMHIADADTPGSGFSTVGTWTEEAPGFAHRPPYTGHENPFGLGTHRVAPTDTRNDHAATWAAEVPEPGRYAVYVSYQAAPDRATQAAYTVRHTGGATRFFVNQRIGGGTWVYLDTFQFSGAPDEGVTLSADASGGGATISADAVRFGGGMGDVARGPAPEDSAPSGRPRFVEAARYYQQFAGAPPHVWNVTGEVASDYVDDYQSRGEWVNWLRAPPEGGAGYGPVGHRDAPGLGIPVDLSLAFHTDAGVTDSDSTIGTLMIVNTQGLDSTWTFPNGVRRLANRDLGDLLQTQVVNDLRARYDAAWTRRALWDRRYSEATRPNVPSALLELLSQQNFSDMRFAHDPRFRRDVSRALYKAILRFLATQHGFEPVVQPLPPSHVAATLADSTTVTLRWRAVRDPLEPSAAPEAYVVYTRVEDGGWDNGRLVRDTTVTLDLARGTLASYRVAAVNAGGESAPSEALAVLRVPDSLATGPPVLVVNGFTRVGPPATVLTDSLAGFVRSHDAGVPDVYDLHTTGAQHAFRRGDAWRDDDDPGHGASYGDLETTVLPGNTFDFVAVHGAALREAGRSFASASADAVAEGLVDPTAYAALDLLLGEQKTTPWPPPDTPPARRRSPQFEALPAPLRGALARACDTGTNLLVTGAYVGSDTVAGQADDAPGPAFLRETLGVAWRTGRATTTGGLFAPNGTLLSDGTRLAFVADHAPDDASPPVYAVEAPDALEPADSLGATVLRYAETNMSAGVARRGPDCAAVTLGVPFETITTPADRTALMQAVLRFFGEGM